MKAGAWFLTPPQVLRPCVPSSPKSMKSEYIRCAARFLGPPQVLTPCDPNFVMHAPLTLIPQTNHDPLPLKCETCGQMYICCEWVRANQDSPRRHTSVMCNKTLLLDICWPWQKLRTSGWNKRDGSKCHGIKQHRRNAKLVKCGRGFWRWRIGELHDELGQHEQDTCCVFACWRETATEFHHQDSRTKYLNKSMNTEAHPSMMLYGIWWSECGLTPFANTPLMK